MQRLFTAWSASEEATAEQRAALENNVGNSPRCSFRVHVDAQSLDGCLRYELLPEETQMEFLFPNCDLFLGQAAYINIVKKVQEIVRPRASADKSENNHEEEGEEEEEDEGEEEDDKEVDSIKMCWPLVLPDVYTALIKLDMLQICAQGCEKDGACLY